MHYVRIENHNRFVPTLLQQQQRSWLSSSSYEGYKQASDISNSNLPFISIGSCHWRNKSVIGFIANIHCD